MLGRSALGQMPLGVHITTSDPARLVTPLLVTVLNSGRTYLKAGDRTMSDFFIKQGDTLPNFVTALEDAEGTNPDLTGASALFLVRNVRTGAVAISGTMSILDPRQALVSYAHTTTDTANVMEGLAEVQVTFPSTRTQTFPNPGQVAYHVTGDVS